MFSKRKTFNIVFNGLLLTNFITHNFITKAEMWNIENLNKSYERDSGRMFVDFDHMKYQAQKKSSFQKCVCILLHLMSVNFVCVDN